MSALCLLATIAPGYQVGVPAGYDCAPGNIAPSLLATIAPGYQVGVPAGYDCAPGNIAPSLLATIAPGYQVGVPAGYDCAPGNLVDVHAGSCACCPMLHLYASTKHFCNSFPHFGPCFAMNRITLYAHRERCAAVRTCAKGCACPILSIGHVIAFAMQRNVCGVASRRLRHAAHTASTRHAAHATSRRHRHAAHAASTPRRGGFATPHTPRRGY